MAVRPGLERPDVAGRAAGGSGTILPRPTGGARPEASRDDLRSAVEAQDRFRERASLSAARRRL